MLFGVFASSSLLVVGPAPAQTVVSSQPKETGKTPPQGAINVSYDERLRFYINLQTKDFLIDMSAKESLLLQTIKNLTAEIQARGIEGLINDDPGFESLYKKLEAMMESYTAELEAILAVLDEITALSRTLEKERRHSLAEQVGELKTRLVAALENRELYKKAPATRRHVASLVKEYSIEVDSLLRMYSRLQAFQKSARAQGDTAVLPLVEEQKAKIMKLVGDYNTPPRDSATAEIAQAFLKETEQLSALLTELDRLEKAAAPSLESTIEVEAKRRDLVMQLDNRLLALLGYKDYTSLRGPTIEQVFQVWRKERIADYQRRLAEYTIMKTRLLQTGGITERSRMLERDLTDALLNYAAKRYLLAELQFNTILQDYDAYFSNWDALIFY
ncbi:MAG: hypothetical protein ONA90_09815, partial [candidate division KSB1 bacterium]|nr:hypothetical protein [candidate division KSB1 bacterium]